VSPAGRIVAIIALGLALGGVTQVLQGVLTGPLSMLANGLSPWLIAAFATGAGMPTRRWAAASGPILLFAALAGYYALVQLRFGYGGSSKSWLIWGGAAVVAGPIFGTGGWAWRRGDRPLLRGAAAGLVGGLLLMEAFYLPSTAGYPNVAVVWAIAGVLAPLLLGRTGRERLIGLVASIPWAIAGTLALVILAGVDLVLLGGR
jgi:hypothetical protein